MAEDEVSQESAAADLEAQRLASLKAMAGGTSHDFNNFLAAILGNISIIINRLPSASPLMENAREIEECTMEAMALSNQLRTFCGCVDFRPRLVNLCALLIDTETQLRTTVNGTPLSLPDHCDLPMVKADPDLIRRLVFALLRNAGEACVDTDGEIWLEVGTVIADAATNDNACAGTHVEPGPCVFLRVGNTGRPLPDRVRWRMFEPFFTTQIRAPGMGLPVVLGIAQAHKAALVLDNKAGAPVAFSLVLPQATPA